MIGSTCSGTAMFEGGLIRHPTEEHRIAEPGTFVVTRTDFDGLAESMTGLGDSNFGTSIRNGHKDHQVYTNFLFALPRLLKTHDLKIVNVAANNQRWKQTAHNLRHHSKAVPFRRPWFSRIESSGCASACRGYTIPSAQTPLHAFASALQFVTVTS